MSTARAEFERLIRDHGEAAETFGRRYDERDERVRATRRYSAATAALLAAYDALATGRDAARTEADEWRRAVEEAAP